MSNAFHFSFPEAEGFIPEGFVIDQREFFMREQVEVALMQLRAAMMSKVADAYEAGIEAGKGTKQVLDAKRNEASAKARTESGPGNDLARLTEEYRPYFTKERRNLTKQAELLRIAPDLHKTLFAEWKSDCARAARAVQESNEARNKWFHTGS